MQFTKNLKKKLMYNSEKSVRYITQARIRYFNVFVTSIFHFYTISIECGNKHILRMW